MIVIHTLLLIYPELFVYTMYYVVNTLIIHGHFCHIRRTYSWMFHCHLDTCMTRATNLTAPWREKPWDAPVRKWPSINTVITVTYTSGAYQTVTPKHRVIYSLQWNSTVLHASLSKLDTCIIPNTSPWRNFTDTFGYAEVNSCRCGALRQWDDEWNTCRACYAGRVNHLRLKTKVLWLWSRRASCQTSYVIFSYKVFIIHVIKPILCYIMFTGKQQSYTIYHWIL